MLTFIKSPKLLATAALVLTIVVFLIGWLLVGNTAEAQNTTESTYEFSLTKKFSDVYPTGYKAAQFKFKIVGTSATGTAVNETVDLDHSTDDTANAIVSLPEGTYTITEVGPASFVPGEWTVQWSGYGCQNANGPSLSTLMTVSDDLTGNICRADNQWRHGNLTVEKIIVGTSTDPSDFDFTVTQGSNVRYDGPFDTDGVNEITIAKGDYVVVEDSYGDYTTTYSDSCTGTIAQGGSVTCTITNTFDGDGGGGGGVGGSTGVLVVQKVIVGTTTVPFNNFSFSYTGASGTIPFAASGTNSFIVATGTYSVTETSAPDYTTSYNNCTNILVTANATSTCTVTNTLKTDGGGGGGGGGGVGGSTGVLVVQKVIVGTTTVPFNNFSFSYTGASGTIPFAASGTNSFIVATGTYSVTETSAPDYTTSYNNCTNILVTANATSTCTVTNTLKTDGGGGGGGGGSSSGTRTNRNSSSGGSSPTSNSNSPDPTPTVLGEQVSIIPLGAANAGAGGSYQDSTPVTPFLLAAFIFVLTLIRNPKSAQ